MNEQLDRFEQRLARLGAQLAEQPSIVDRVMNEVDRAAPVRIPRFNHRRYLTMLLKPKSLAAAAAVLALVTFGMRPWISDRESAWWLAPPAAWAGELQNAIAQAGQRGFVCQEQFIHRMADGSQGASSTTSSLFVADNRYRRDTYDQGRLRESQWYVQGADGLTLTSVRYDDKTHAVTHDPQARETDVDPLERIESLPRLLEASGRRIGPARIADRDAIEFEIDARQIDAQGDDATAHVWLDQATKLPLKIAYEFAAPVGLGPVVGMTLVQDRFDWNPALPANTFEPEIPAGFTERQGE